MAATVGVSSKGTGTGAATAVSAAVTTQATGSTFVVFYQTDTAHTGVTDNKGNTYTARGTLTTNSGLNSRFYVCENGTGGASHQATGTGLTGDHSILFLEIYNLDYTGGALDQSASVLDSASPYTVTSGTTSQADEIAISAMSGNSTTTAPHAESTGYTIDQEVTTGGPNWTCAIAHKALSATGAQTPSWTETGSSTAGVHILTFKAAASSTLEQEGFQFFNDDGSESAATSMASQDTNITKPKSVNTRLRVLINSTLDPLSTQFRLEYNKNSAGYLPVPLAASAAISYGALNTASSGTTSCQPTYPTTINAATSKLFCVVTGRSNTQDTAPTMPAGWTWIGGLEGGTGTWGIDTGTRRVDWFQKDVTDGTETGTLVVSLAGTANNTLRATLFRIEVPAAWGISATVVSGADTSNDTAWSVTASSSVDIATGDIFMIGTAQNLDTGTQTSVSVSASGITFGSISNKFSTQVTNGNDHRSILDSVVVTAGSGTVAPTYAYTVSAAASGVTSFLRLRPVAPPIAMSASSNITASGQNTTARLAAPSGKTTSDFVAGRIQDDENPADAVDITTDDYTECEWCMQAAASNADGAVFQFRVTRNGTALETYTVTPQWTIGTGGPTGTMAVTEPSDVADIAGDVLVRGTLAATESPDVVAIGGDVIVRGTLAATESSDAANIAGDVLVEGALAVTESSDVAALAGDLLVRGTLAATESSDLAELAGDVLVRVTLAATESSDVAALSGNVVGGLTPITGNFDVTESSDAAALSGDVLVRGALAATEFPDVAALAGDLLVRGNLAVTESSDTTNLAGDVLVEGSLAVTESSDVAALTGDLLVRGTLAAAESSDFVTISGNRVTVGSLAATESSDVAAFTGDLLVRGTLAATESSDAAAFAGVLVNWGDINVTESPDVAILLGAVLVEGALDALESSDIVVINQAPNVEGSADVTESPDTVTINGSLVACIELNLDPKAPDLDGLIAAAFLDRYGRFAKRDEDVATVRLFYSSSYCPPSADLTAVQFRALTSALRIEIQEAPSAAGLIDTDGISNA